MINVDECSCYSWEQLNLILELLAEIVCSEEWRISWHDDINLDKEFWAGMICSDGVDLFNLVGECDRLVDDELQKLFLSRLSGKELEFVVDSPAPRNNDAKCNDETTHWIND